MLDSLLGPQRLLIRQVKEWSEILLGYEARNRYEVQDETGRVLARVAEEGAGFGRWLGRQFLGSCRQVTLHVLDLFGIEFAIPAIPPAVKKLLFAATFLVDFTCFENNQRRGIGVGIDVG